MTDIMLLQDLDEIIADAADEAGLESPTFAWEPTTYALKYRDMEAAAFAPAASSNALGYRWRWNGSRRRRASRPSGSGTRTARCRG